MKFRMRKRRRVSTQKLIAQRPPEIITVATPSDNPYYDGRNDEGRWAIQKVFASQLLKISRKHLNDSRQTIRIKSSLADASTSGDSSTNQNKDPHIQSTADAKQRNQKPFPLTCGGGATNSLLDSKQLAEQEEHFGRVNTGRTSVPCMAPRIRLEYSDHDDDSENLPRYSHNCLLFGDLCHLLFPFHDSQNHDLGRQPKLSSLFLLTNGFARKKPETNKNGIPKVITVVIPNAKPIKQTRGSCCGEMLGLHREQSIVEKIESPLSDDTSILRLEESLKKANLDADVEEKCTFPQKGSKYDDPNQDRTAEGSSVTSSISTHYSLKFGTSIVKLPSTMIPARK